MKRNFLLLINSRQAYLNSGETIDEVFQRSHDFCIEISQYLDDVRPKSEDERQAIAFAKEQLALNDLAGAYKTIEPFCTDEWGLYDLRYAIAWMMILSILLYLMFLAI